MMERRKDQKTMTMMLEFLTLRTDSLIKRRRISVLMKGILIPLDGYILDQAKIIKTSNCSGLVWITVYVWRYILSFGTASK